MWICAYIEPSGPVECSCKSAAEQNTGKMTLVLHRSAGILEGLRSLDDQVLASRNTSGAGHLSVEKLFGGSRSNRCGSKRTKADRNVAAAVAVEIELNADTGDGKVARTLFEFDVRPTAAFGRIPTDSPITISPVANCVV